MRVFKCDICGKEMSKDESSYTRAYKGREGGYYGILLKNMDVCQRCLSIGEGIDFQNAMIGAWKIAVKEAE